MKINLKANSSLLWQSIAISALISCGANPYKSYEKKDPSEDATVALENNDPDKAITILTDALESDPTNTTYKSILALAYAQRAGVDPLTVAQKMASTGTSSASTSTSTSTTSTTAATGNGLTSLFGVMPDATDANIADVDKAVALILEIPSDVRIKADTLKLAIFETAAVTLRSKQLDTNGDGILEPSELLKMSTASATAIISQLASASNIYSGTTSTSTTDKAASEQIAKIQTAIQAEPGATDQEKLQNYLAKTSS